MDYDYFAEQLRQLQRSEGVSTSEHNEPDPDMPPLEPIAAPPPTSHSAAMDVDDNSTTAHNDHAMAGSENTREVEMQFEDADDPDDPPLPEIEPVPAPTPRPNRRARVEDDDDDERDRRHPSQRITNPSSAQQTRTNTPLPAPRPQMFAFDFLHTNPPSSSSAPPPASTSSQPNQTTSSSSSSGSSGPQSAPSSQEAPRPANAQRQTPLFPGFALSFDVDGIPLIPPFTMGPGAAGQTAPGAEPAGQGPAGATPFAFADLFNNPAFLHDLLGIEPDVDDPERADKLIAGLEEVPVGLVKRLERIGGIGASGTDLSGGDSGCAVCWEKLLPDDDGEDQEDGLKSKQKAADGGEKKPLPKIVALPCAHHDGVDIDV
ncbi:hypothetical protein NMY22_g2397 [Coprinellus aureogranulatus]|nr:hypothetical protein NMY22_g2397 [Coprinellus aureogranulatus]